MKYFVLLMVAFVPLCLSAKEIRVVKYDNEIELTRLGELHVSLYNVSLINLQTREFRKLGDFDNGVINLPEDDEQDMLLSYRDIDGNQKQYFIPSFRNKVLIGIPADGQQECVKYLRYTSCDAIQDLENLQFGSDCGLYNYILLDYCENSPVVTSPGQQKGVEYPDYKLFVQSCVNDNAVYFSNYCDEELVFMICEEMVSIKDYKAFHEKLQVSHLLGKKGVFSIRFGVNCEGKIVSTEIISNNTNATINDLQNIFSNEIRFKPARQRGRNVDSYYPRKFRIRNDWIKIIK